MYAVSYLPLPQSTHTAAAAPLVFDRCPTEGTPLKVAGSHWTLEWDAMQCGTFFALGLRELIILW